MLNRRSGENPTSPLALAASLVYLLLGLMRIFFADAALFRQAVLDLVADQTPHTVVVDLGSALTFSDDSQRHSQ